MAKERVQAHVETALFCYTVLEIAFKHCARNLRSATHLSHIPRARQISQGVGSFSAVSVGLLVRAMAASQEETFPGVAKKCAGKWFALFVTVCIIIFCSITGAKLGKGGFPLDKEAGLFEIS